jgi:tetratricopeptide (TPR) repeat protein/2-polyprenyl-3-methyl-5-hydroxy-6-metoxy-1,4-benzoquinol methylase
MSVLRIASTPGDLVLFETGPNVPNHRRQHPHVMTETQLFKSAIRHHQAGQLADAERIYRQILAANPSHFGSLHLLGILAHQVGRHDAAIDLFGRAIACNDRVPECHYNMGLALAAAGRMQEAAAEFATAIALKDDYAEAHMNLGNAYKSLGRGEQAIASFERALALKPNVAELHYNLANVFAEKGDLGRATIGYERALALKADYAEAHSNLAIALIAQGQFDDAVAHHRRALALNPNLVQAQVSFGNALMVQGRLEDATAAYEQAIARRPDFAEAHCNLAYIRMIQGKAEEAVERYRRALTFDPDLVAALINIAKLLLGTGDQVQAFDFVKRALRNTQTHETKTLFAHCVKNLEATTPSEEHRALVTRALSEGWGRPKEFARFALSLIKLNPQIASYLKRAKEARRLPPRELIGTAALKAAARDELLRCVMETTRVQDVDIERFLTAARAWLLDVVANPSAGETDGLVLAFYCSLARQCFINEYVFSSTDEELARVQALRESLSAAIQMGEVPPELHLAAVAAYGPLEAVPGTECLLQRSWSEPVSALLVQQVQEPQEERRYRASMPRLTAINDRISVAVKVQYEDNPYPRWINPAPSGAQVTVDTYLRRFAPAYRPPEEASGFDLLFAGCGTGQEVIEAARYFSGVRILAIDLSLTSLGYAKRKAHALGITNVEFAQADILELESIGRRFDVIESNGVLHHMAEPMRGWRVLASLLRLGGVMHIGLYSALARQDIVAARTFIAERGYQPTLNDIKRCREEMMAADDGTPLKSLTKIGDFFSASECRDLLFHVQEHRLSLPEIKHFLQEQALQFLGFDIDDSVITKYRARFPAAEVTDLDRWHIYETENPNTFSSMYQLVVQKPQPP